MIIIGYLGVGKSTVSNKNPNYIDFDSSMFPKEEGWEKDYVERAEALSEQGFTVFVSAHKAVQDLLLNSKEKIIVVYPAVGMRHSWIKKLSDRYDKTQFESDKRALERCVECFSFDIARMSNLPFKKIELKQSSGYNLEEMINDLLDGDKQ